MKSGTLLTIVAVDCCEHVQTSLRRVPNAQLRPKASPESRDFKYGTDIDLIVVGIGLYPVRRFFISELRRVFPSLPILVLRRERLFQGSVDEAIRGEFILADQDHGNDYDIVRALRAVMPFDRCEHLRRSNDYDTVRDVMRLLGEKYADPKLDLNSVAQRIRISPKRLSIILNQRVGMSFRHLLRQVRIEEAKRMLATRQYSVKETAARAGFTDSHYFSRSFKELTGQSAGEFQERSAVLN